MSQPEDTDPASQRRKIGSAATLLSLDSFAPFYPYLDVPAPAPEPFKDAIRAAILENRKAFEADSSRPPDLRSTVDRIMTERFGRDAVRRFNWWYKEILIQGPGDYRAFATWKRLLLGAKNFDADWSGLGLPPRISDAARQHFSTAIDNTEISDLDDRIRVEELSDWDLDMYTRHNLHDEFADPWITTSLMFNQLRYRKFMNWLLAQLSPDERRAFHHGASQVAARHNDIEPGAMLPDPTTQVLPDAHAFR